MRQPWINKVFFFFFFNRGYWQHVETGAKNYTEWFLYISVTLEKDDFLSQWHRQLERKI